MSRSRESSSDSEESERQDKMTKKAKEPKFGEIVNETFRRSVGETTNGYKQRESNREINDWMR